MTKYGLKDSHWHIVSEIFKNNIPPKTKISIWLFGSRAAKSNRPFSDVDLLIEADPILDDRILNHIRNALEDSNLPFKFDIVPTQELVKSYEPFILKNRIKIFEFEPDKSISLL